VDVIVVVIVVVIVIVIVVVIVVVIVIVVVVVDVDVHVDVAVDVDGIFVGRKAVPSFLGSNGLSRMYQYRIMKIPLVLCTSCRASGPVQYNPRTMSDPEGSSIKRSVICAAGLPGPDPF
jgi:hypothetical protein